MLKLHHFITISLNYVILKTLETSFSNCKKSSLVSIHKDFQINRIIWKDKTNKGSEKY